MQLIIELITLIIKKNFDVQVYVNYYLKVC